MKRLYNLKIVTNDHLNGGEIITNNGLKTEKKKIIVVNTRIVVFLNLSLPVQPNQPKINLMNKTKK